ncbi:MAG: hypothetical protein V3575_04430 [Candidatus Absconditabacteria bacterium]
MSFEQNTPLEGKEQLEPGKIEEGNSEQLNALKDKMHLNTTQGLENLGKKLGVENSSKPNEFNLNGALAGIQGVRLGDLREEDPKKS